MEHASEGSGARLRLLGTFERIAYEYATRRPYQYCLMGRIDATPSADLLASALAAVQRSHPMLRVEVDPSGDLPVFRETDAPIPVVVAPADADWRRVAAEQVAQWIEPGSGPLLRAVLIPQAGGVSRIGLTVCHVATDGRGALRVLDDLVRALDGQDLPSHPFPEPQEAFAGSATAPAARPVPAGPVPAMPDDPREPPGIRPFDGRPADVSTVVLDTERTTDLLAACRRHGLTLQPVLCAVAAQVLDRYGRDLVNVGTAFDLRRAAGLPDDVADRFLGVHTVTRDADVDDVWTLAATTAQWLAAGTSPEAVNAALTAMAGMGAVSPDAAEIGMRQDTHADVLITNLGVAEPPDTAHVHLVAVDGLVLVMHVEGEQPVSAITSGGSLRLVLAAHDPVPGLLEGIGDALVGLAGDGT